MGEILKGLSVGKHFAAITVAALAAILVAAPVLFLPGCGWGSGADGGPDGVTGGVATVTSTTSTVATTANSARTIEDIEREASRLRGLPIKNPIAVSYMSRDQLREEMKAQLAKEYNPEELASEEKVLKKLGLMAADESLGTDIEQMMTEEVAGYYDDETKQLKLISDTPELNQVNQVTLAHESTHAIQDQNFSLSALLANESTNDDQDLAWLALVEGDASLVEQDFMTQDFSAFDMASLLLGSLGGLSGLGGNSYLQESLLFPYTDGMSFVSELRSTGGWARVNAAYANPPQSTEQILHPQKYFAGEAPLPLPAAGDGALIAAGWKLISENVLGEFGIRQLLSPDVSLSKASRAAAGWGGDAVRYYEGPNGASLLFLQTEWDSSAEAAEFATVMGEALESRYGGKFDLGARPAPVLKTADGAWMLVQHGAYVAILQAPDAATGATILQP
ncbi:MAG: hypothetical protein ACYC5F_09855 [Thermoleophilia bacterium]